MYKTGWLRDLPDIRDYDAATILPTVANDALMAGSTPSQIDIKGYCSPIENQGQLGSCTAQAVVGMAEYMERRYYRRHIDGSRLFVYKMARELDGFTGDTGAYIRTAMKGLRLFGAPPERYWPYDIAKFDVEPPAFVYSLGQNWQSISYYRIDSAGRSRQQCLDMIKTLIASWRPIVLGFSVYSWGNEQGEFPMPKDGQRPYGGHAVMVCGYDDGRKIGDDVGALLIRNSWGTGWGDRGYGWLPYGYILKYLSSDFWVLLRKEVFME